MTKTRLWLLLTAVVVVAVLAGGWFLLVSPKRAEAADLGAQTAATEQQISALRSKLTELQDKQRNLPAQQAALEAISKQIPSDPALPALIRALTNAGRSSGVDLMNIAPGAPAPLGAVGGTTGTAAATQSPINVITVTVAAKGSYNQVQQFVQRLESLQRAFLVQGFQLAPDTAAGSSGTASGDLLLTVNGQVFTSAGPSATAAANTAGGTTGTGAN
jgi:type IV pilus assembly protein PilO